MKRRNHVVAMSVPACAMALACAEIPTGGDDILSFRFDPLASPSVIVGDSLRDSLGAATPLSVTAFSYDGTVVPGARARFRALDTRARVDSLTGFVIGDSAGTTARIVAAVGDVAGLILLPVVLRPDTVIGSNERDSLSYSLTDTAANISNAIGVRVLHGAAAADSAVGSLRVTFGILYPADTAAARLVDASGRRSDADTTDASGIAARRVKVDVSRLTAAIDSVIVNASVKYRGAHLRGSPMRLVLKLKPR